MKVAKFGGSSVANANQLRKVANIIKNDPNIKIIVVSAPGKYDADDVKVTDTLIQLGNMVSNNEAYTDELKNYVNRFKSIITELSLSNRLMEEIQTEIQHIILSDTSLGLKLEAIKAQGEDSLAKVLSTFLIKEGLDARYLNPKDAGIIVSNEPGNAQVTSDSYDRIFKLRETSDILIIPGFFGYTADNQLVTFSRGGSDITGSIVAAGVRASIYENYTDVDSVFTVNPNIVKNPKEISTLTYKEMRELSYAGFSVFHDEALIPAFKAQIPVSIKNTNNPEAVGTRIVAKKLPSEACVAGIASDAGFCTLYLSKYLMNREIGFGRKLLGILEDEGISFEHAPSGIDDISVIIRESRLTPDKEAKIMDRIQSELKPDTVAIHRNLAMIMIVGEGLMKTIGVAQKATTAITSAGVNIEMINQGSSEVSMMFGVRSDGLNAAVQALYNAFFK